MSKRMVLVGLLACGALLCGTARAPAAEGDSDAVAMKADFGPAALRVVTPAKARSNGRRIHWQGGLTSVEIGGRKVAMNVAKKGRLTVLGIDVDADGAIGAREAFSVGTSGVRVVLRMPDAPEALQSYAIFVKSVKMLNTVGGGKSIYAYLQPAFCMTGKIDGQDVRLYDDDLDGKFTQGGRDAIAIGRSFFALPLMRTHRIGGALHELVVTVDGASVTATAKTDVPLGVVERPFRGMPLKCLVMMSKNGAAFDVVVSGKAGLPAGEYTLAYGLLGAGGKVLPFRAGSKSLVYPVEAGMSNRLRIGGPFKMQFSASVNGSKIVVGTRMRVLGAGGEEYLVEHVGGIGTPYVSIAAGTRTASRDRMKFG